MRKSLLKTLNKNRLLPHKSFTKNVRDYDKLLSFDELNSEWISNKARFSFDGLKLKRLSNPYISVKTQFFTKFKLYALIASNNRTKNKNRSNFKTFNLRKKIT